MPVELINSFRKNIDIAEGSIMLNYIQAINANQIRKEKKGDTPYVVMTSFTMPDDVVLNGILYEGSDIDRTIKTIDGSPAPIDHPRINDTYVSAYNAQASLEFGLGINKYIGKEGNRHKVEKWFNEELLNNTERGKRLLSAIDKGDPIHSSTGVILTTKDLVGNNKYGAYNKVASIDHFDHDAVLPDSVGAGTPEKTGTGIYLNADNNESQLEVLFCNESDIEEIGKIDQLMVRFANMIDSKLKSNSEHKQPEGKLMPLLDDQLNELGVNFDESATEAEKLGLLTKHVAVNAAKSVETLTAEDVKSILASEIKANKEASERVDKELLVDSIIKTNSAYVEADKEMLMNSDIRMLKTLTAPKHAAPIRAANHLQEQAKSMLDTEMPE